MEIYKREKINPVRPAACRSWCRSLCSLAFYWVLLESARCARRRGCCGSRTSRRKTRSSLLPILMGVAMYGQFQAEPGAARSDAGEDLRVSCLVIMTVMMAWFPSGLVLYWLTNTLLSIAQQWNINRVVEAEAKKRRLVLVANATTQAIRELQSACGCLCVHTCESSNSL